MKVVTAVVNNPIFIEMQYYTLKKYMKCDYEFIVFNDAKSFPDNSNGGDTNITNVIQETCKKLGIKCINIPNEHHRNIEFPSFRAADSMNIILDFQKQFPDKYLLLDRDMFLIDDFNLTDYEKYDCAIVLQSRNNFTINYIWCGICYFDFNKIKNKDLLNWDCCDYCDTGGKTQIWLKTQTDNFPTTDDIRWTDKVFHTDNIYYMKHLWSCTWNESEIPDNLKNNLKLINFITNDPRNQNGKFFCEIYENKFLHYRAGSDWENRGIDFHINLSTKLKECLLD